MPNVLILDDEDERHDAFRAFLRPEPRNSVVNIYHVYTIKEFADRINEAHNEDSEMCKYQYIFLDHDLDISKRKKQFASHYIGNGMDAVTRITNNRDFFAATKFIVHSLNQSRGCEMTNALTDAGLTVCRRAFAWLDVSDLLRLAEMNYWPMDYDRWNTADYTIRPMVFNPRPRSVDLDWD